MYGKKSMYAWPKLFSHNRFKLVEGRDFVCSRPIFNQQVRNAAVKLGCKVSVIETREGFEVYVRERNLDKVPINKKVSFPKFPRVKLGNLRSTKSAQ